MRLRRPVLIAAVAAALILAAPRGAHAECTVDRDAFKCPDWGVELYAPPDWELSAQPAYPGILVSGVHRNGRARMTLAVQKLETNETAKTYADRNRLVLKKVGFRVGELTPHPTGASIVDATSPDRRRRIRQGYRVHASHAYTLTLGAPANTLRSYYRAFDDTLRSISFSEPTRSGGATEPGADTAPDPGAPPATPTTPADPAAPPAVDPAAPGAPPPASKAEGP